MFIIIAQIDVARCRPEDPQGGVAKMVNIIWQYIFTKGPFDPL